MYNLHIGNTRVENLRLSGQTVADIFTGKIRMWNDPAITRDMNGHALPAKRIEVVVASSGSGTTAQFTDWMSKQYPSIWKSYAGADKSTSYYPINSSNITAQGNDASIAGVIASASGEGSIGYVQYSYALNSRFPVAKVLNSDGYYSAPTPFNVAVALTKAQIDTKDVNDPKKYLTQELSGTYADKDPRSYPLSAYSYMIIPTAANDPRTDASKAATFANFSYFFLCQGQQEAAPLGYSPLPLNLVRAGFAQVTRFSHIVPADVQHKDATTCNNPTFDPAHPNANRLAEIDPAPPACDRQGEGPCGALSTGKDATKLGAGSTGSGSAGSGAGAGGANGAGAGGAAGKGGAGGINPETGLPYGASAAGAGPDGGATATQLAAFRPQGMTSTMGVLAAIEVVLVLLVPAFVARAISRRRARNGEGR
jgi:ABC-type phosphate transport system substrate-binding protein